MNEIETLINRLNKIGIKIEVKANYPWIYLDKINGVKVTETFMANHGFTVAWLPIRTDEEVSLSDVTEIFKLIRKYERISKKDI